MKKFLAIITVLGAFAGIAVAGCGKKETNTGELKAYDADSKAITIVEGDKEIKLTLTPDTEGGDKVADLVGKKVEVVSEHKKVDSVKEAS